MSDLITGAMVEAAAKAGFAAGAVNAAQEYELDQPVTWDGHLTDRDRAHERLRARAALEAVAPLIAAKAWDEGYAMSERELDHAYGGHPICPDDPSDLCRECGTGNPYRADQVERGES